MTENRVWLILAAILTVLSLGALAEERRAVPVIGLLLLSVAPDDPVVQSLRRGLNERGYIEDRDFRIVHRGAEGHSERVSRIAEDSVRLKVDVIVTGIDAATYAARRTTSKIPIVASMFDRDPVASGFIASFSHSGGNITGLYTRSAELSAKRLELLRESLPGLSNVGFLVDSLSRKRRGNATIVW